MSTKNYGFKFQCGQIIEFAFGKNVAKAKLQFLNMHPYLHATPDDVVLLERLGSTDALPAGWGLNGRKL